MNDERSINILHSFTSLFVKSVKKMNQREDEGMDRLENPPRGGRTSDESL